MARRKETGLDLIAAMPWPIGMAFGVVGYGIVRFGLPTLLTLIGGPFGRALGDQLRHGIAEKFALLVLALCWTGAAASFAKGRHRQTLLEKQTGLDSLSKMTWREFEMLVGEAFRRRGYSLVETGLGGPDGGVDLILRLDGRTELVQCKQWRRRSVSVSTVREMWGLLGHHGADGVKIVCIGSFTSDARAFADGKSIELIGGEQLLELVRSVQAQPVASTTPSTRGKIPTPSADGEAALPCCPACGGAMARRSNRRDGTHFLGCKTFPRCRGTRTV